LQAEECNKSSQETEQLEKKVSSMQLQINQLERNRALSRMEIAHLRDHNKDQYRQSHKYKMKIAALEKKKSQLEREQDQSRIVVEELRRRNDNENSQSRMDKKRIAAFEKENKEIREKLKKAEKAWAAFKDVFGSSRTDGR
jgi:chromosome segregation ATPase